MTTTTYTVHDEMNAFEARLKAGGKLLIKSAERNKRIRLLRKAREASAVSAEVAKIRRAVIVKHLRPMAKAGISLADMARNLEDANVLTPRGNARWTSQQVKTLLRHALKRQPKKLQDAYLPKVGVAATPKPWKVRVNGTGEWEKRTIKAGLPGGDGYFKPKQRRKSQITKRPPKAN
jgi:hypothetical protein